MPLLDAFGREIPLRPRRLKRAPRPKNVKPPQRRPKEEPTGPDSRIRKEARVEVTLLARHSIGDVFYGPGRVIVSRKVAEVLREGEQRAQTADANFAGTRACVIGPGPNKGLRVQQVAPEFFDMPYLGVLPFGVVDKSGNFQAN